MSLITSLIYTAIVGALFIYLCIFAYDFLYGEKQEKQLKKIRNYYQKETIKKIEMLEHVARKYSIYQIRTDKETLKVKIKPGYKIVKLVPKKQ